MMKILIAGDYCPQHRVSELLEKRDFQSVFGEIKEITIDADYSIVNLECPVTKGAEKQIEKYGPALHCTKRSVEALEWTGANCVTLANNHFYDFGEEGVKSTLTACCENKLDYVGGGKNLYEASQTLYKEINGDILAVINCCEHEFSIATETSGGSNPLNPIQQYYAIQEAKKTSDYILVIIHGGHEHYQLPSPRMQETYRFFIDAGADAVVNHHQHCYSGYESYHGKPIFYGLGNFCFDKPGIRNTKWNEGYLVLLELSAEVKFDIIPYNQCSNEARIILLDKSSFDEHLQKLNAIILDPVLLKKAVHHYYATKEKQYSELLEPTNNRLYLAFRRRGWLPSMIVPWKKKRTADYVCCESHCDILKHYLLGNK